MGTDDVDIEICVSTVHTIYIVQPHRAIILTFKLVFKSPYCKSSSVLSTTEFHIMNRSCHCQAIDSLQLALLNKYILYFEVRNLISFSF